MERTRHRIHVLRHWEECPPRMPRESVLVEVPGKWAHSVVSLVQASQEYRHAGLMVTNVGPDSQAARAGMNRGDVLVRYQGQELESVATLRRLSAGYAQGASARKPVRIEAARGREDVAFEVLGGRLGITVSRLLHRSVISAGRRKRVSRRFPGTGGTAKRATPRVVHTLEEARRHSAREPALVLVPSELARPLMAVLRALERGGSATRKKRAKSLLAAARRTTR